MRLVLGIEYNGTHFCGWQSQPNGCGVQDTLEIAIQKIAGHVIRVHAAGRTDTGVHALSQVVHFDTQVVRPTSAWVRGVNAYLPSTVRVLWAKPVGDDFHARFSATERHYEYVLFNTAVASAVNADKAGWYHSPLNVVAMSEAIAHFCGEHDFSAFRASQCQAKSPIRRMHQANITSKGEWIIFHFSANAFLQHQVRNMVGALVYVGNGKNSPDFIKQLLLNKDRTLSPPTFSPNGLYLTGVKYADAFLLPNTNRKLHLF
jgi:tRNA pseudouridine38-40 synthase